MKHVEFEVPLLAVAKGRPRVGKWGVYTPAKTRRFESEFRELAEKCAPEKKFSGPLFVELWFNLPRPKKPKNKDWPISRPDLDNFIKIILDSLIDFWNDDAQVVKLTAGKYYTRFEPSIKVSIQEI